MKQNFIQFKRSIYGDWYGIVNGRIKYQSPSNIIKIGRLRGNARIELESLLPTSEQVKILSGSKCLLTTGEWLTEWFDSGSMCFSYFPDLKPYLLKTGLFLKNHWDKGLTIGRTVWEVFKELGIMAYHQRNFTDFNSSTDR